MKYVRSIIKTSALKEEHLYVKAPAMVFSTQDELKDALSKQDSNFQLEGKYPGSNEVYYYGINDFKK